MSAAGANDDPDTEFFAIPTMLTLRTSAPFDLLDRLEQQLSPQRHTAERLPAAEVHETATAYELLLELPGVDKDSIDVRATDRSLVISAERRSQHQTAHESQADAQTNGDTKSEASADASADTQATLLSEFRYGTWSRSFRFQQPIEREQLQASYRDGLLRLTAPKAHTVTSVKVQVEG